MSGVRKRSYDLAMRLVLTSTTRVHRVLDRASRGRLGRHFPGGTQVVWISTLGRRSGQWRRTPLLAVRDGAGSTGSATAYVVAGSNAGQARVPGWVFNVRDHPSGYVEVDGVPWRARFEESLGADRDALYGRLAQSWRSFTSYEKHAERYIPVFRVVLEEQVSSVPGTPRTSARPPRPS